ncbi:MAG: hypothetical protein ISR96_02415, partial [Nitrospira sp.]|nr:hypothetical protein [Nitrospira sp.]
MSSYYRDKWSLMQQGDISEDGIMHLARQIAHSFLDYYLKDCRYEEDYITLLFEMTTCSDETRLTNPATFAL